MSLFMNELLEEEQWIAHEQPEWESSLTMRLQLIIRYIYPIIDARAYVWKTHIVPTQHEW